MPTVRATYRETEVYLRTETDLNWRVTVLLSTRPVALSNRAAELVLRRAQQDDSLNDLRIEED